MPNTMDSQYNKGGHHRLQEEEKWGNIGIFSRWRLRVTNVCLWILLGPKKLQRPSIRGKHGHKPMPVYLFLKTHILASTSFGSLAVKPMQATQYDRTRKLYDKYKIQNKVHQPNDNIMLMGPTKWQWWDHVKRFQKKRVKLLWVLIWLMSELNNENVQHKGLP